MTSSRNKKGKEMETKKIDSGIAWKIYNFICDYKDGKFGIVSLQEALDMFFNEYEPKKGG